MHTLFVKPSDYLEWRYTNFLSQNFKDNTKMAFKIVLILDKFICNKLNSKSAFFS